MNEFNYFTIRMDPIIFYVPTHEKKTARNTDLR